MKRLKRFILNRMDEVPWPRVRILELRALPSLACFALQNKLLSPARGES
jgi:hypothetical protein